MDHNQRDSVISENRSLVESGRVAVNTASEELQAYLAEYSARNSEISTRSDFQHRLLQLHITVLTLILVTGLSGSLSGWVIFVIPIESSLFGMWWIEQSVTIHNIGRWIANNIEQNIDKLIGKPDVLSWERNHLPTTNPELVSQIRRLHRLTFLWPSVIALFFTFLCGIFSIILVSETYGYKDVRPVYGRIFPNYEKFGYITPVLFTVAFLIGSVAVMSYKRMGDKARSHNQ